VDSGELADLRPRLGVHGFRSVSDAGLPGRKAPARRTLEAHRGSRPLGSREYVNGAGAHARSALCIHTTQVVRAEAEASSLSYASSASSTSTWLYVFAVTARLRWPTCSPIRAHGTPPRWEHSDAPVPQVVRREVRDAGCGAGARDRGAEAIGTEALEDAPLGSAVLARHERADGREQLRRHRHPAGAARLRDGRRDTPAAAWFVDVAPLSASSSPIRIPLASSTSAGSRYRLGSKRAGWLRARRRRPALQAAQRRLQRRARGRRPDAPL